MYLIKEMPKLERPRERLVRYGVKSLGNDELLALILRTGSNNLSVLELARKVLYHFDKVNELAKISYQELLQIKGIKEAKATVLLAAIELGRRLLIEDKEMRYSLYFVKDVYFYLKDEMSILDQEHFICLFLNTKNELISKETIFIGTLNQTIIHPREIFRLALKYNSNGIIFAHNHPSGDSRPSNADIEVTKLLQNAGEMMNIHILDHVIIGKKECFSIKENKRYFF